MAPTPARPSVVEVVGASGDVVDDLRRLLGVDAVHVRAEADRRSPAGPPDVVVAHLERLADLDGPDGVPVLALVRREAPEELRRAFAAGAADVLPVPLVGAEVGARVAAAARVARAEARLRARNAELVAWAERAGHDLMTPLAVIGGMAETLEAAWDRLAEPDRARLLASIRNQVAKATAMLDEALALARRAGPPDDEATPGAAAR